ncbi:MAG: flagellar biosynthesis protein FlhB [Bacteroidota bacterium]
MADNSSDQEKTEEPTAKRLEDARKDGNIPISKEVSSVLLMTTAVGLFVGLGDILGEQFTVLFENFFIQAGKGFTDKDEAMDLLKDALVSGMGIMIPIISGLIVITLLVNLAQTQGAFSTKAMGFKGSKLNPISGLKNILSVKGLVELLKGLVKLSIIVSVGYFTVNGEIDNMASFVMSPLTFSLGETGKYILTFVVRILVALLILSIADAVYQRFNHRKQLRMTKQEIKDEFKQMEGDPQVKGQRKKFGMKLMRRKRLDHAVLSSDVVVTNPTHYAVALRYDPETSGAPIVMAKGQRLKALRIKELAKEYGIPIVENIPVARALFATAEEDEFIPADMYRAVAEILAYVYKIKNKKIA